MRWTPSKEGFLAFLEFVWCFKITHLSLEVSFLGAYCSTFQRYWQQLRKCRRRWDRALLTGTVAALLGASPSAGDNHLTVRDRGDSPREVREVPLDAFSLWAWGSRPGPSGLPHNACPRAHPEGPVSPRPVAVAECPVLCCVVERG